MATATISDVRDLIDTDLDDPAIQSWLDRVARTVGREYPDDPFADDRHRADFEATLAALRIRTTRDRRPSSVSLGNASKTYDVSEPEHLRAQVRRLDPGEAFSVGGVSTDTNRLVRSTNGGVIE